MTWYFLTLVVLGSIPGQRNKIPQAMWSGQKKKKKKISAPNGTPEEPEIKLPIAAGSSKKQESSRKTSISALLTMLKPSSVWTTINCGKL